MMNETNIKKMEELLAIEEFAQKIVDAGSYEKAHQLFVESGVEVSYDDFNAYIEETRQMMAERGLISPDGELSEELLSAVSGGRWYHTALLVGFGGLAYAAGLPAVAVACIVVGVMAWKYKG